MAPTGGNVLLWFCHPVRATVLLSIPDIGKVPEVSVVLVKSAFVPVERVKRPNPESKFSSSKIICSCSPTDVSFKVLSSPQKLAFAKGKSKEILGMGLILATTGRLKIDSQVPLNAVT